MNIAIATEMQTLINKANGEISRIKSFLDENEEAFDYMDLKLHDANYYEYSGMERDFRLCAEENERYSDNSLFSQFCENSFDQFDEWVRSEIDKNGFWQMTKPLGRTSKFWLHKCDIVQFSKGRISYEYTMYSAMERFYGYDTWVEFDEHGMVSTETFDIDYDFYLTIEDVLEEIKKELEYISTEFYDEFTAHFEDMLKVYEYIKDVKEDQVKYFKDWLQVKEEDLAWEREQELEEKRKTAEERMVAQDNYKSYCDKYNISIDDGKAMRDLAIKGWVVR